jgi:hypothetical protein
MRIMGLAMAGVMVFGLLASAPVRPVQAADARDIAIGIGIGVAATVLLSQAAKQSSKAKQSRVKKSTPLRISVSKKKPKKVEPWNRPGCSTLARQCNGGSGNMNSCEKFQNFCSND